MNNYQWLLQMDGADRKAWFDAEHVENQERALDGDTESENEDSRERLEADAMDFCERFYTTERRYNELIKLLDRQAAITERETKLRELYRFEENHREHIRSLETINQKLNERIAELSAERDELKSRHCPHYHVDNHYCDVHETKIAELQAQVDELTADLNKEIYERERYRSKFGKCLDYADAIHALMDDEGMA